MPAHPHAFFASAGPATGATLGISDVGARCDSESLLPVDVQQPVHARVAARAARIGGERVTSRYVRASSTPSIGGSSPASVEAVCGLLGPRVDLVLRVAHQTVERGHAAAGSTAASSASACPSRSAARVMSGPARWIAPASMWPPGANPGRWSRPSPRHRRRRRTRCRPARPAWRRSRRAAPRRPRRGTRGASRRPSTDGCPSASDACDPADSAAANSFRAEATSPSNKCVPPASSESRACWNPSTAREPAQARSIANTTSNTKTPRSTHGQRRLPPRCVRDGDGGVLHAGCHATCSGRG